ncbi:MAG: hypothetical protein MJZ75_07060 [Paludibacteraceae bacterium]|nr:hypothetical protein [Paludibacteraceae bacterium]
MAKVTFIDPIASMSGKVAKQDKVALRTRNGRTHAYTIKNPYTGPVTPTRQRTIDAFRNAVTQASIILKDETKKAEWQAQYDTYLSDNHKNTNSSAKIYTTLRGYIIAQLTALEKQ